jgi:hypothetical protein
MNGLTVFVFRKRLSCFRGTVFVLFGCLVVTLGPCGVGFLRDRRGDSSDVCSGVCSTVEAYGQIEV